uniref:Uncharacterized protein n=1 Tax=Oryza rufipogon TaxID=4529 RepID=A0A0E0NSP1_ORYRU
MGLFGGKSASSKQTAKLKSLIKLAAARVAVARRPRLGRRSIARGDVAQLLSIGHLDRALLRVCPCHAFALPDTRRDSSANSSRRVLFLQAEQVIDEDNMLEVLDIVELYCKILIEQATQLDKPKECGEEIKEAAAGLMFASARCGDLPELLDARAILADKFGRDFAAAAKDGAHGVVDPTLVRKLSGAPASTEQKQRLTKVIAAENDILLEFPENTGDNQGKQNEQAKNVRAEQFVEQNEVKREHHEVQGRQRFVDEEVNPRLARLSVQEQYADARMAAEAAFKSASFAAMAARAAVELSRSESQGKGSRGGGGGGYEKVHPVQNSVAGEKEAPPSWKPHKPPSPSTSPSWSDRSTATSVWSEGTQKGKGVVFDGSDEEVDDVAWTPQLRRPPYRRASTMGIGGGAWNGEAGRVGADPQPFQDGVYNNSQHPRPPHRRHASELGAGAGAPREPLVSLAPQRGQYRDPPYRRDPAAYRGINAGAAQRRQPDGAGARPYESSDHVHPPYARIVSALERSNEHIARHEEVRRIGTGERVLQERVYGAGGAPGRAPLNQEQGRLNSVRTRR